MILILADAFDTHADVVEQHLKEAKVEYFRLNLDVESLQATLLHFDGRQWCIDQGSSRVYSQDIRCIWPRRLTVSLNLEQQTSSESSAFRLWRSEWNRSLYGLYANIRDKFWMNGIASSNLADNKYFQMTIARKAGFLLPNSISSNNKSELIDFAEKHKFVALKFMSQDIYRTEDGDFAGIYVNKLQCENLSEFGGREENPITLQAYIQKDYEVRYTFVDGIHFACKIESQKSERASIDWRRYDIPNTPHSVMNPPDKIKHKINKLMKELDLSYGALDFIVDKNGDWWYLEVNSAGQWLWIEDLASVPISATIARSLIDRANGDRK